MKCVKHNKKEAVGLLAIWSGTYGGGEAMVFVCKECMNKALAENGTDTANYLNQFLKEK